MTRLFACTVPYVDHFDQIVEYCKVYAVMGQRSGKVESERIECSKRSNQMGPRNGASRLTLA